ncbi:hypothetical protein DWV49_00805 [Lactobacillus amylovorus subsp. animalium]|nr:hypothetical protein DWV49_00805 [Lactobacillus amylovorus]
MTSIDVFVVINILSNRSKWTFYFLSSVQFNFTIGENMKHRKKAQFRTKPELSLLQFDHLTLNWFFFIHKIKLLLKCTTLSQVINRA